MLTISVPVLWPRRPDVNMVTDPNFPRRLMAQNVGDFKIEWTYGWFRHGSPEKIVWWGRSDAFRSETDINEPNGIEIKSTGINEIANIANNYLGEHSLPYGVYWHPRNQQWWPKAIKFTFTLYDSKGILKNGRTFEHIVYIGN